MRQLNDAGIGLIKSFETLRLSSYDDVTGTPLEAGQTAQGHITIGWGHTGDVTAGQTCTRSQAENWLKADLAPAMAAVENLVTASLNDNQFAALVSFVFNVGVTAFKSSTLLKNMNGGQSDTVPQQLAHWNKVGGKISNGLTRRRLAEAGLWSTPVTALKAVPASHDVDAPSRLAHLLTLGGITVGAASSTLSDLAQQLQPLAEYGGLVKNLFLVIAVASAGVAVLTRVHSFKKEGV